jgi:type IV secretory pathway VirB10-like protein
MGEGANLLRLGTMAVVQVGCLALLSSGCARPKAKTIADLPPLEMPVPPPRDVETSEIEPLPPVPLPAEPARNAPPRTRPAPPARESRAADAPKPEPAKPEAPTESEPPPKTEEPAKPPTTLQTTPAEVQGEVERNIRSTLARATHDLNRIDYRLLNADARTQYDTAKSFIRDADLAVKAKNLVYAKSLADKAAALAVQLGGK